MGTTQSRRFSSADGFAANPQMTTRRFPPPWSAEVQPNHYVVRDANKQPVAYVYYENEPGRRSAAKLLTKDEARRDCDQYREAAGLATLIIAFVGNRNSHKAKHGRSHMDIRKQQEQSAEDRIGSMIGKAIVPALIAFLVWGYAPTLASKLNLF
jgi:hypothetical protein